MTKELKETEVKELKETELKETKKPKTKAEYAIRCSGEVQKYLKEKDLKIFYIRKRKLPTKIEVDPVFCELASTFIDVLPNLRESAYLTILSQAGELKSFKSDCPELMAFRKISRRRKYMQSPLHGVVVRYRMNGKLYIGWSLCHLKSDKFNREIGIAKAINRAVEFEKMAQQIKRQEDPENKEPIPHSCLQFLKIAMA